MKGARFVKKLISYHFNFVPAHIEKEEIVRYVYEKDGHLIIPPLPDVPEGFEKRHLSASLAAGILSYKYHLHMPFERQLVMLDGSKIKLAKTTLFDYSVAAADALDGIYEAIRERVLSDYRCHIDIWLLEKASDPKFIEDNLGKAINYALERIDKFYELMKNGLLKLENNLAERCMREHTLGRKNYLFCQNAESESRTCKVYTIIESCKLSGIDPYRYLNYIFSKPPKLGETWENYLPCNLKWNLR